MRNWYEHLGRAGHSNHSGLLSFRLGLKSLPPAPPQRSAGGPRPSRPPGGHHRHDRVASSRIGRTAGQGGTTPTCRPRTPGVSWENHLDNLYRGTPGKGWAITWVFVTDSLDSSAFIYSVQLTGYPTGTDLASPWLHLCRGSSGSTRTRKVRRCTASCKLQTQDLV